ncbi:MAG: hypothetical protein IJN54_04045 [Lachnospiraceae bacterium]|nr:hypothetical protein [Lachnospiraceae bacterium]
MKRWLEDLMYKMNRFMYGRYGNDEFNLFLSRLTIFLLILNCFVRIQILSSIAMASMIMMIFRSMSKNYSARAKERDVYFVIKNKITSKINLRKEIWQNRKTHRYYKCKKCKATLRVPKGKGKIEITCRKCGHKMRKKS